MRQVVADSRDHTIEGAQVPETRGVLLAAIAIPLIAVGVNEA
jgi:hypothetical protein